MVSSHPTDHYLVQQGEDEVTIHIKEKIQNCGDGLSLPDRCIYKVPIRIRCLKEDAYTPKVVSIGPFHYHNNRLRDMERHKQILFKRFTQRTESSLDDLVHCVKDLESKVRASYSETIGLNEQQLVELILMDAGFIIELFITIYEGDDEIHRDALLSQPCLGTSIILDLALLENQLPFFVVEEIFNKANPQGHGGSFPPFLRLACRAFGHNEIHLEPNPDVEIKHFTDLLRQIYLQGRMTGREPRSTVDGSQKLLYNVNALQEAGIELKASKSKSLLELKFEGHVLEIPHILVEEDIEIFLRNVIALEQCHYPYATYITDYALLLNCLIDTSKDVDLLVHHKILHHYVGDKKNVSLLFNGLSKNVIQLNFNSEYVDICKRLNNYCEDSWHQRKATLRHDYCNTPWRTVASIAGIILLVLTVVQTIFSVLQVVLNK